MTLARVTEVANEECGWSTRTSLMYTNYPHAKVTHESEEVTGLVALAAITLGYLRGVHLLKNA